MDKFGGQHIEATGLNGDYLNAVIGADSAMRLQELGKRPADAEIRIQTYEEYIRQHYVRWADAMMQDAKPTALEALDREVHVFNQLSPGEKKQELENYKKRILAIIRGEQM